MRKEDYLEKRKGLLAEATDAMENSDTDLFNTKSNDINDLDNKYNSYLENKANLEALSKINGVVDKTMQFNSKSGVVEKEDLSRSSMGYRQAFMNFIQKGEAIPAKYNTDATTATTDASAVIPTTLLPELIKEMESYGNLWNAVRKINIPGGLDVAIQSTKPTATWTTEGSVADTQKITANTKVSFSYYKLQCRIAITLIASVTTLTMFEQGFVQLAAEAMAKAMDLAIIEGSGVGEPLGITKDTRVTDVAAQTVTMTATQLGSWNSWKSRIFSAIKLSYNTGVFIMAKGTKDLYVDGLVDANGQPIARITMGINGVELPRINGKSIILVEDDILSSFTDSSAGDIFMVYCKLSDYAINSNMMMTNKRYFDEDADEYINKSTLIADGKLLDTNSVLLFEKA